MFSYREKRFWLEGFERLDPHSVYHYPKNGRVPGEAPEGKVGIPRVLLFWKKFPFWSSLFRSLDYDVILSKPSDRSLIRESSQNATSETCLPAKITYGHINNLLAYDEESEQLDFLFLPALISNDHQGTETPTNYNCPLVQSLPYVSNGEFEFNRIDSSVEAITQSFHFYSEEILRSELMELGSKLGKSKSQVLKAYEKATKLEQVINSSFLEKGKQALEQLTDSHPGIVLLSRPYNGCDPGLNMDIPDKLRELGARPIPIDFLPVEEVSPDRLHPSMQWDWGKRILSAAKIIKDTPNLYAIYLSHFRCGPDSFIIRYVKEILKDEPFLHLELDEHSADAGILTRCEAFLDSLS